MKQGRYVVWLILLTGIWLTPASLSAHPFRGEKPNTLAYAVKMEPDQKGLQVHIECTWQGTASGMTKLILPDEWGGQKHLFQGIKNLKVTSPKTSLSETVDPHIKTISHEPNQLLHIEYDLVRYVQGNPQNENRYLPMLDNQFFHWIGHTVWVYPAWSSDKPVSISLEWKNLPKGWALGNSFGVNQRKQTFQATVEEFTHASFTGGDFRIQSGLIGKQKVFTAVRGSWTFSDQSFGEMVRKIIAIERAFWEDRGTTSFFVPLIPIEVPPNSYSFGGTGLTNSFALFCSTNAELKDLKGLLAHEYFHNWNPPKLGRFEEPEPLLYWFSEGFTDYYAYMLLLRGGMISLDEYLGQYNRFLEDYAVSPVRTESNQQVLADFWNNEAVQKLPYRRGLLLATNWNAEIRRATSGKYSLDTVMRDLVRAAQGQQVVLTAKLISQAVSRYAGRDVFPDIQRYVEKGELIPLDKEAFGPDIQLETKDIPTFELGFHLDTLLEKKQIAGVIPTSAAFRAGLRDGQPVVRRRPIYLNDPAQPVEITVRENGQEQTIRYLPEGPKQSIPYLKLRPAINEAERERALRWLVAVHPPDKN